MEDRFFDQKQKCRSLWSLIPKYCDPSPNIAQDLERLLEMYREDIQMGQFGAAVSAMDVSAMKCEMYFPLECYQSAKVRTSRCEACPRKIRSCTCPNRTAMRVVYPNVHTLIKSTLKTSCTTAFD